MQGRVGDLRAAMRFRGSVVTSFASKGWFFDSLTIDSTVAHLKSRMETSEVRRSDVALVEVRRQRVPLMVGSFIVFRGQDGVAHERMFCPWRTQAVRHALEELGWPVEAGRVTARTMLFSPKA